MPLHLPARTASVGERIPLINDEGLREEQTSGERKGGSGWCSDAGGALHYFFVRF